MDAQSLPECPFALWRVSGETQPPFMNRGAPLLPHCRPARPHQVLRGNIRVLARVRPPTRGAPPAVSVPLEGLVSLQDPGSLRAREFEFDAVFGPAAAQEDVFREVAPLVRSAVDGYNACILAYGQTGSGKVRALP